MRGIAQPRWQAAQLTWPGISVHRSAALPALRGTSGAWAAEFKLAQAPAPLRGPWSQGKMLVWPLLLPSLSC